MGQTKRYPFSVMGAERVHAGRTLDVRGSLPSVTSACADAAGERGGFGPLLGKTLPAPFDPNGPLACSGCAARVLGGRALIGPEPSEAEAQEARRVALCAARRRAAVQDEREAV